MVTIPISTISLPRTMGRWNALPRVRSGSRWNASCLNKRSGHLENENIDVISRRCISGHVSTNHNGWRSGGAISTPREGGYSQRHFTTSFSMQQYRLSSSWKEDIPPLPVQFLEAYDDKKFDPSTRQRYDVPFDPIDGKPLPSSSRASLEDGKNVTTERNNESNLHPLTLKIG